MDAKEQIVTTRGGLLVRAPAKLNLSLLISGKRPDGFHNLETVMAKINWYDEIEIRPNRRPGIELACKGPEWAPPGRENLVYRAARLLLDTLDQKNQPVEIISSGCIIQNIDSPSEYQLEILWPPPADPACRLNPNDSSTVLRISDTNGSILLCGDTGKIPQQLLLEQHPDKLKSDVLLLPHHGSPNSILPEFLHAVAPQICLNSSGILSKSSQKKLNQLFPNQKIFHTYKNGAITITLKPDDITLKTSH